MPPESTVNGSGECDAIIPIATRCDDRASVMTWRFTGGDCEQRFTIQAAEGIREDGQMMAVSEVNSKGNPTWFDGEKSFILAGGSPEV